MSTFCRGQSRRAGSQTNRDLLYVVDEPHASLLWPRQYLLLWCDRPLVTGAGELVDEQPAATVVVDRNKGRDARRLIVVRMKLDRFLQRPV